MMDVFKFLRVVLILGVSCGNGLAVRGDDAQIPGAPPLERSSTPDKRGPSNWPWDVKSCRSGRGYSAWWDTEDPLARAAAIEAEAEACLAAGLNTIILEDRYILGVEGDREFWACPSLDRMIPKISAYMDVCHGYGLKVISHLTVYIASDEYAARHPDHRQVNVVTGRPAAGYEDTGLWKDAATVCYNNPDFQVTYQKALKRLVSETGADGFMVDEVQFISSASDPWTCGCTHCRAEFTRDTGYVLPTGAAASAILGDYGSALFRAWFKWRIKQNGDFYALLRQAIDEAGGQDKVLFGCYSMPSEYGNDIELESVSRSWNLLFTESQPGSPHMLYFYNYLPVIADMKYTLAAAEHQGTGFFTLFYTQSPAAEQFTYLLGVSQGSGNFTQMGADYMTPSRSALFLWEQKYSELHTNLKPLANIGVLYPSTTRTVGDARVCMKYFGWCNALTDTQIPYNVLMEKDLTPARLAGYDVVILPNATALSSSQAGELRRFVGAGGTIIATSETSLYDETGAKRPDFGLSDVLGVSYRGEVSSPHAIVSQPGSLVYASLGGSFADSTKHLKVEVTSRSLEVLARVRDASGNLTPSVTVNGHRSGRALYIGFLPDVKSAVSGIGGGAHPGTTFTDPRVPEYTELLSTLVRSECADMSIRTQNIPAGVVVQGYTHTYGAQPGTFVTLLNCIGGRLTEVRTEVPADYSTSYPSVLERVPTGQAMRLSVKADNVNAAYLVSPDFDEAVQLDYATRPGGYVEVGIPDLARFEILYLNRGSRDFIKEKHKTLVKSFPEVKVITTAESSPPQLPDAEETLALQEALATETNDILLLADKHFTGGWVMERNGRMGVFLYGALSDKSETKASFELADPPQGDALLTVAGANNNGSEKCPIRIALNGQVVFEGPNNFLDSHWAARTFAVGKTLLKAGSNEISVRNISDKGILGNKPWFSVSFTKITLK